MRDRGCGKNSGHCLPYRCVDVPDRSVYSSRISGNTLQVKPDLQFKYSDQSVKRLSGRGIAKAMFLFLGACISKRYPTYSIVHGGIDTAANYKLNFFLNLLVSAPFLETRPPTWFMLSVCQQFDLLIALC